MRHTTEAGFSGYDAPRAVFLRCPQAPDACHHGLYGPEGMLRVAVQKTAGFPQLLFLAGRRHLFRYAEAVPYGPGCSADHSESPVVHIWWLMSLFVRSCWFSVVVWFKTVEIPQCCSSSSPSWYRGRSHGPDCTSDHRHCTIAVHGDRRPCCAGRESSTCAVVEKTVVLPRLHSRGFRLEEQLINALMS